MALPATNLLANYIAATGVTESGGLISQWADQVGTAHLTAVGGSEPVLATLTDGDAVVFSEGTFFTAPVGLAAASRAVSLFVAMEFVDHWKQTPSADQAIISLATNPGKLNLAATTASETGVIKMVNFTSAVHVGTSLATVWSASGTSSVDVGIGATQETGAAVADRLSVGGGLIGALVPGAEVNFLHGRIREIAVYDAELSPANVALALTYFEETYGTVATAENRVIVCEGDSLTRGNITQGDNWTHQFARLFTTQPMIRSVADGGRTLADMVTNEATRVTAAFAKHSTYTEKYAILWGGTNDISGTTSGTLAAKVASVTADLSTWIAAQASDVTTVVLTIIPRSDFDVQAEQDARAQVNEYIVAGSTGADIVVDLAAHPGFQVADINNLNYVDQTGAYIHISVLGAGLVATLVRDQLFPVPTVSNLSSKHSLRGSLYSGRDGFNIALPEDAANRQLVTVKNVSPLGQHVRVSVLSTETALIGPKESITLTVPAMSSPVLVVRANGTVRRSLMSDDEIPYQVEVSMGGGENT